ncbi:unnamed protein product [Lactuca saligna]|uniref:Uncharacterized protein n=1 Tax=Lactuca saligna TaxID=75948 RepID=A0AA35YPM8_LACSI|nr:unnamed protein product [Lactuca saligna]
MTTTTKTVGYTTFTKILESLYKLPTSPEYLYQEESIAQRHSWGENLIYYTGIGYLSGVVVDAGKGLVEATRALYKVAAGPWSAAVVGAIGGIVVGLAVVEEPPVVASEVEASKDNSELKVEPVMKEANGWTLNVKIKVEKDPTLSAIAGSKTNISSYLNAEIVPGVYSNEKPPFVVELDGSLPFYMLDAYEEFFGSNARNIILFGKVKVGSTYHSCFVVVKNMQRFMYAIPNGPVFEDSVIMKLFTPSFMYTKHTSRVSGVFESA